MIAQSLSIKLPLHRLYHIVHILSRLKILERNKKCYKVFLKLFVEIINFYLFLESIYIMIESVLHFP